MDQGLPCTNCQQPVDPKKAKFFGGEGDRPAPPEAAIFVCPSCYDYAMRVVQRGARELLLLSRLHMDNVRAALAERRLFPGPAPVTRDLTKREVLQEAVRLMDARDAFVEEVKRKNPTEPT